MAGGPAAVALLPRDQLVAHRRVPAGPVVAAGQEHRLGGVVVSVEVVPPAADPQVLPGADQVLQPVGDRVVAVDPGVLQARHPRRGPRVRRSPRAEHVAEAAVFGVLALADVGDRAVDGFLGHRDPGVAGRPQGHDLGDGHGDVRVVGLGVVPPAALVVLGVDDEPDGLEQHVADPRVAGHAVHLPEKQRPVAVAVHRPVGGLGRQQPRLRGVGEHEPQRRLDLRAVLPPPRQVAVGHERQRRDRGDPHVAAVAVGPEAAVGSLQTRQLRQPRVDTSPRVGGDLDKVDLLGAPPRLGRQRQGKRQHRRGRQDPAPHQPMDRDRGFS